jgi:arylsulfatase A-like enzyme
MLPQTRSNRRAFLKSLAARSLGLGSLVAGCAGQFSSPVSAQLRAQTGSNAIPRPNILLIVAGSWRAQAVPWANDPNVGGFEGASQNLTPNLARFGREALTFPRAYSAYARTEQARAALLTGQFPHALGLSERTVAIAPQVPTLATFLGKAGYRTASFTEKETDDLITFLHVAPSASGPTSAPVPFFALWTLDAGLGFAQRVDSGALDLRLNVPSHYATEARRRLAEFYGRLPSKDQAFGLVMAALDRPELLRDTAVIFTSDHGQQLGSQNMLEDDVAYEESMRIPLAIRYPRGLPAASDRSSGGRVSKTLISQVDLAPSILKLAGAELQSQMQGRELSSVLFHGGGELPEAVYAEGRIGDHDEFRMLVHGYDKLVVDSDGQVKNLYNLADDPLEQTNLAKVSSEQLKRDSLKALLQGWMRRLEDRMDPSGLRVR